MVQDVNDSWGLEYPQLYGPGQLGVYFNKGTFLKCALHSCYSSLVLFFVPYLALYDTADYQSLALLTQTCLIITVCVQVCNTGTHRFPLPSLDHLITQVWTHLIGTFFMHDFMELLQERLCENKIIFFQSVKNSVVHTTITGFFSVLDGNLLLWGHHDILLWECCNVGRRSVLVTMRTVVLVTVRTYSLSTPCPSSVVGFGSVILDSSESPVCMGEFGDVFPRHLRYAEWRTAPTPAELLCLHRWVQPAANSTIHSL